MQLFKNHYSRAATCIVLLSVSHNFVYSLRLIVCTSLQAFALPLSTTGGAINGFCGSLEEMILTRSLLDMSRLL